MSETTIEVESRGATAYVWMNRPALRNALGPALIGELDEAIGRLADDAAVRAIVLGGRGSAFSAGADLNRMREAANFDVAENEADAIRLARLMQRIDGAPKPVLARIHGPAYAGAMGLIAACDVAIASTDARFCLSEARLGLIPAMIGPYVLRAIGERASRRYFLSAEVFDAAEALRLGLVQRVVAPDALDAAIDELLAQFMQNGPRAIAECKRLIRDIAHRPIDDALARDTASRIAAARASDEGREGVSAFLEKRRPRWHPDA